MRYQELLEKTEKFEVRHRTVIVNVNPTIQTLKQIVSNSKYGLVRGFTYNDDIYFWDAAVAVHHQIWTQITNENMKVAMLMLGVDLEALKEDASRESHDHLNFFIFLENEIGFLYVAKNMYFERVVSNASFERLFGDTKVLTNQELMIT